MTRLRWPRRKPGIGVPVADNLTAAREALARLSALLPVLRMYASMLRIQHPKGEIKAAVCAYNPDGTGNVGPAWAFDPFLADLIAVAGDDESEDETPALIAVLDALTADLAALRIEHEAHAALLTVTRGERDHERQQANEWLVQLHDAGKERNRLRELIACLADNDPCWFDHHGGCQAHGYLSLTAGERCPMAEAQEIVAADLATKPP